MDSVTRLRFFYSWMCSTCGHKDLAGGCLGIQALQSQWAGPNKISRWGICGVPQECHSPQYSGEWMSFLAGFLLTPEEAGCCSMVNHINGCQKASGKVKYGVRFPKFIWTHWLRLLISPPPPHLGSHARALLVSQDRRHLFVTPWPQDTNPPGPRPDPQNCGAGSSLSVAKTVCTHTEDIWFENSSKCS